jgi:signal peptidase II
MLTKALVRHYFDPGGSIPVAGDVVRLTYVLNSGAAFGLGGGRYSAVIFPLLPMLALGVIAYFFWKASAQDRLRLYALALVLGGAVGNLLDRFRAPGAVVDFLDVGLASLRWPVFNVADVGVTLGAVCLVLSLGSEDHGPAEPAVALSEDTPV